MSASGARTRASRAVIALLVATVVLSAVVRFADLAASPSYIGDENYYARDASALLTMGFGTDGVESWMPGIAQSFAHPELGVEAIAGGIRIFGDGPWGWRLPSALAGTLLIALVYPLGRRLRLAPVWALAATVLAASDTLLIVQSRLAMLDIFVALGTVVCIYLALRAAQSSARFWTWVVLCGLAGGAAVSCKWSGGLAVLVAVGLMALRSRSLGTRRAVTAIVIVLGLTSAVYVASYAPYFLGGHTAGQWLHLQRYMIGYNWTARPAPAQSSTAITWPFDVYPIWYHWGTAGHGLSAGILAIGNPLLWWGAIVSFVVLGVQAITRRDPQLAAAPVIVAVLYAPWLLTSRPEFLYYMTPVVPFLAVLVALALGRLCTPRTLDPRPAPAAFAGAALLTSGALGIAGIGQTGVSGTPGVAARLAGAAAGAVALAAAALMAGRHDPLRPALFWALSWAFVGATTGLAIAFIPFVVGYPVTAEYFNHLMWLPTWW